MTINKCGRPGDLDRASQAYHHFLSTKQFQLNKMIDTTSTSDNSSNQPAKASDNSISRLAQEFSKEIAHDVSQIVAQKMEGFLLQHRENLKQELKKELMEEMEAQHQKQKDEMLDVILHTVRGLKGEWKEEKEKLKTENKELKDEVNNTKNMLNRTLKEVGVELGNSKAELEEAKDVFDKLIDAVEGYQLLTRRQNSEKDKK